MSRSSTQKRNMYSLSDDEDDLPELSELLANLKVPQHLSPSKPTSASSARTAPPNISRPSGHGAVRLRKPGSLSDSSSLLLRQPPWVVVPESTKATKATKPTTQATKPSPRPTRAAQQPTRCQTPARDVQTAKDTVRSTADDARNETKAKKKWDWDSESDECSDAWQEDDDTESEYGDNSVESGCDIKTDTAALRKPVASDRTVRSRRADGPSRQLEEEMMMAAASKEKAAGIDTKMDKSAETRVEAAASGTFHDDSTKTSKLQTLTQVTELSTNSPDEFFTPPSTPQKPSKTTAASPRKRSQIPQTPHGLETDLFWSKDFMDDWNDQHSPLKPMTLPSVNQLKSQSEKGKKRSTKTAAEKSAKRASKKSFDASKSAVAEAFLRELDDIITLGKLAELSASTGGVRLVWTNKLNTTAGRAHWKREATRVIGADGSVTSTTYKHHAHIDIATKVIDDELRLLNVIAHEFCHLATFMVTGVVTNPHGKEFKQWASKCSRLFGHRGVDVTTKHSYDIDFKYVWECMGCALEYKRHSKSINLDNSRCGRCKGALKQTKPVPRATGKPTKYQEFVREQMKAIRAETPGITQKDLMKVVAQKWAADGAAAGRSSGIAPDATPLDIVSRLGAITL